MMSAEVRPWGAINYDPCRYGRSQLLFRGPKRQPGGRYVAVIGGAETYGRFMEEPYPAMLERLLGLPVVNLGSPHAEAEAFMRDETVLGICAGAVMTVVQMGGAAGVCNPYFRVHPRRNDRVVQVTDALRELYPELDFTDHHFIRHLLGDLARHDRQRFARVVRAMRGAWVARMRGLLGRLGGAAVLLWMSRHGPDDAAVDEVEAADPLLVSRRMLEQLENLSAGLVEVTASREEVEAGLVRMLFSPLEQFKAAQMLGPVVHERAARELAEALQGAVRN